MKINIEINSNLIDYDAKDYDDMWNYITEDQEVFVKKAASYLTNFDVEYYQRDLKPLYEKLKEYYDE